jgi:hypothetical protein
MERGGLLNLLLNTLLTPPLPLPYKGGEYRAAWLFTVSSYRRTSVPLRPIPPYPLPLPLGGSGWALTALSGAYCPWALLREE